MPDVDDLGPKLDHVRRWCQRLAKPVEVVELDMEDGSKASGLEIEHGDRTIWAIDGPEEVVDLVHVVDLGDEAIRTLANLEEADHEIAATELETALLSGRTAYRFYVDPDERLTGYATTQVLHVPEDGPADEDRAVQRLADATQELVVAAQTARNRLGAVLDELRRRREVA